MNNNAQGDPKLAALIRRIAEIPSGAKGVMANFRFGPGVHEISETIYLMNDGGEIRGSGVGRVEDMGEGFGAGGTVLKWVGPPGHPIIQAQGDQWRLCGAKVSNLALDCNGIAGSAINVFSAEMFEARNLSIRYPVTAGIYMASLETAAMNPNAVASSQRCRFSNIRIEVREQPVTLNSPGMVHPECTNAMGIILTGNSDQSGNVSFCRFEDVYISTDHGPGIYVVWGDNNRFDSIHTLNFESGYSLILEAPSSDNYFTGYEPGMGKVLARTGSVRNHIYGWSWANGAVPPIIEEGASLEIV